MWKAATLTFINRGIIESTSHIFVSLNFISLNEDVLGLGG